MKVGAFIAWVLLAVLTSGCQPSTPSAEADDPPGGTGRPAKAESPAADTFEGLDPKLVNEIRGWRKGDPPPPRLLRFPNGPPTDLLVCGMRALGDEVGDYIDRLTDADLLVALMFDRQADDPCVRAAERRLLELRGVRGVRAILADRRRTAPIDLDRREVATLVQLLSGQYARLKVASIAKSAVGKEEAAKVLAGLKADLEAGLGWAAAYRRAADRLPDTERSRREGGGSRTHVCYAYDGLVAPTGFDILDRRLSADLDPAHLAKLFAAKGGTHVWEATDAYWLYHAEAFEE